ncbi:hypothetical protein RyT2_14050 [Pseudolactococcus yaeyamensis]
MRVVNLRRIPDRELVIIDQLASKESLSREAYLRQIILKVAHEEMNFRGMDAYKKIIDEACEVIHDNQAVIEKVGRIFLDGY